MEGRVDVVASKEIVDVFLDLLRGRDRRYGTWDNYWLWKGRDSCILSPGPDSRMPARGE